MEEIQYIPLGGVKRGKSKQRWPPATVTVLQKAINDGAVGELYPMDQASLSSPLSQVVHKEVHRRN